MHYLLVHTENGVESIARSKDYDTIRAMEEMYIPLYRDLDCPLWIHSNSQEYGNISQEELNQIQKDLKL